MKFIYHLILGCLVAYTAAVPVSAQVADTIFIDGKILTVNNNFSIAEALAISGERITAVGSTQEILALSGAGTRVFNLDGATVIPGLIDNHFHFLRAVQRWHRQPRLDGINSRTAALQLLADKTAEFAPGEWILTQGGWYPEQFADQPGGFTLAELDRVAPENPLFLQERYNLV